MKRRWYYWKRALRANRPMLAALAVCIFVLLAVSGNRGKIADMAYRLFEEYGVHAAGMMMEGWFAGAGDEKGGRGYFSVKTELFSYLEELEAAKQSFEDPAYDRMLAKEWEKKLMAENASGNGGEISGTADWNGEAETEDAGEEFASETITMKPAGSVIIREKLADYDYVMKHFYSVHPTTTAGRDLMDAEKFLSMDFSLEKEADQPQILIYHTHSQEEFADHAENPEATIVGVGAYLAELLETEGYQVIHDTSVYDFRDGKLDRSQAYTYALDGITGILQKYPSIEVVLDIHRDGVAEGTRLVTEVNEKPTARIMFFNGTSQTPDGPIEYLPNPNREANMAFSFQMQLLASEQYPEFTRKIYLKGLRYNQHVRARTALIEVGAQTNTYAEALNAMEPLADILCQVLTVR